MSDYVFDYTGSSAVFDPDQWRQFSKVIEGTSLTMQEAGQVMTFAAPAWEELSGLLTSKCGLCQEEIANESVSEMFCDLCHMFLMEFRKQYLRTMIEQFGEAGEGIDLAGA